MTDAKVSKIPMDTGYYLQMNNSEEMSNNQKYQSLIGALLYITVNTHVDIVHNVSITSRKLSCQLHGTG